jgi:hypothetical protein
MVASHHEKIYQNEKIDAQERLAARHTHMTRYSWGLDSPINNKIMSLRFASDRFC